MQCFNKNVVLGKKQAVLAISLFNVYIWQLRYRFKSVLPLSRKFLGGGGGWWQILRNFEGLKAVLIGILKVKDS